MCEGINNKII